jgi:hypothetical protein
LILNRPSKKRNLKNPNPNIAEFFHSFRGIKGDRGGLLERFISRSILERRAAWTML